MRAKPFAIAVHGGAGAKQPNEDGKRARDGVTKAAAAGHAILSAGGSALDAVVAAVRVLEEDEAFNAGKGAVLTRDGTTELDASVMEGTQRRAGAVTLVRTVRNPVLLAREVLEHSPHVFLGAEGAESFAKARGLELVAPNWHRTEKAVARLERWKAEPPKAEGGGTVGAVACDGQGRVAAATSTGGTTGKWPGRIGDTPLIGAGTWAHDASGAVSCTGTGERIIRTGLARTAADLLHAGKTARGAARAAIRQLEAIGGDGGVILVDARARLGLACNTERMACAWVDARGHVGARFEHTRGD